MEDKEFSFPFKPYDIQLNLMKEIYSCIEEGKVGVFESPTGTGKSLSVLCSTMTWLENFERKTESNLKEISETKIDTGENAKDWIAAYKESLEVRKRVDEAKDKLEGLDKIKQKIRKAEEGMVETRKRKQNESSNEEKEEEEDFGPGEYSSDQEEDDRENKEEEVLKTVKIYYASRTHSQLEQLVDELGKTKFKPRLVTIASRQALCANEKVQKLKINHLINEKCMELRKNCGGCEKRNKISENEEPKKTSKSGCPYYKQDAIEDLANGILARKTTRPSEVTNKAQKIVGCPYFATRKSVSLCQLVLLPYQVLLHSATRAAWGVELEGNVVVLDEAHNVLQTIGNIHSCEISSAGLKVALQLIQQYIETYRSRLKTKNLMYMRLLLTVVTAFSKYLQNPSNDTVLTIQSFLIKLQLTSINLFKLVHYIEATDLCKKFHGFYIRHQRREEKTAKVEEKLTGIQKLLNKSSKMPEEAPALVKEEPKAIPSPLFSIKAFLEALNNRCEDGRIIVDKTLNKLRFILLNPADQLRQVVDKSRATVLIGGTMEPAGLLIDCLTRGRDASKLKRFSCEHVIDNNQLVAIVIDKTVDGRPFSLTYQTRNDEQVLRSLGLSLIELVGTVPNGAVAFFTSYDVMNTFINVMKKINLYIKLQDKKNIFIESRAGGENIWDKFVTAARSSKGAILFAVAGGKMSEGINFSDELGRAVFMIGLPYPNKSNLELQENMKFMDGVVSGGGKQLYDSLCMHAVNQAIGRAIRHRNDYASVFLVDSRFSSEAIQKQLSGWISRRIQVKSTFSEVLKESTAFFAQNRK